jgi:hypothetical protein
VIGLNISIYEDALFLCISSSYCVLVVAVSYVELGAGYFPVFSMGGFRGGASPVDI